jgi:hypothetical protein
MQLLIEKTADFETVLIEEDIISEMGGQKNYIIKGPFLQSEVKNHNRRIYAKEILEKEVNRYTKAKIETDQAVGELGHPDTPTINLERASHKITALVNEGNNWIGTAKILNTPFGVIVKNLIDEKVKFGVSSRGLGSLKESNGVNHVQSDYFLVTPADIVSDPSGPDCWATAVMEGKEWALGPDGLFHEMVRDRAIIEINKTVTPTGGINELKLLTVFESILDDICKKK